MICPECKGQGKFVDIKDLGKINKCEEFEFVHRQCTTCEGKGYLTPEEAGFDKF